MSQQTTDRSFDELARALASGSISRGKALRLLGAALVGGTLASLGMGGVAAAAQGDQGENEDCKRAGKKCKRNEQCCSGNCSSGICGECPTGQEPCGGMCRNSIGGSCSSNSQCCSGNCSISGTCQSCTPGTSSCGRVGGFCLANASGAGTTCVCTDARCVSSCDMCSASEVCLLSAGICGPDLLAVCASPCAR